MRLTLPASFTWYTINFLGKPTSLILVIFCLISSPIFSQTGQKIEVEEKPFFVDQDSLLAQDLFKGFIKHVGERFDSALFYAKAANELSINLKDSLLILRSSNALGYLYREVGEFDISRQYYNIAAGIAEEHSYDSNYYDRIKVVYNGLGLTHYLQGTFEKALEAHIRSIEIRKDEIEKTNNYKNADLGVAYTNIGVVYYRLGDLRNAIDFQHKAIIEFQRINTETLADNYANLGLAFSLMYGSNRGEAEYAKDSALYYFKSAEERCDLYEYCEENTLFEIYNGLALIYGKIGDSELADYYINLAIEIDKSNPVNLVYGLHNKAEIEKKRKNYTSAKLNLDRAQEIIDSVDLGELKVRNLKIYGEIFAEQEDYKSAYYYLQQGDTLEDELMSDKMLSTIKSLEIDFAESENLEMIENQSSEIAEKTTKIEEQTTFLVYLLILIVLAVIFSLVLFRINIERKKALEQLVLAKKDLEDLNNELEERVQERTSELNSANEALQQSNQELDNFIYKTSHDIRGPLATLQGICNVALMDVNDPKSIDYLQKLGKTAAKLNEILSKLLVINQINNALISTEMIDFGLIIDHVVQDNRKVNAAEIKVIKEIESSLQFRSDHDLVKIIIANLVNNSFKFYNQSERIDSFIKIAIGSEEGFIKISIVDNGIGIDEQQGDKIFEIFSKASHISDSAGLGLYLVKLSVEKLKGQVKLSKTREKFTEFRVKIPLMNV